MQDVDLVQDDRVEGAEIVRRAFPGAEQGELFGGGHQDVRRRHPLAALLGIVGDAGPRLAGDRKPKLLDGAEEIAAHIDGEGLQGRDIEGVQPWPVIGGQAARQADQAGQETRQGLAAPRGRNQKGVDAVLRRRDHLQLMRPDRPAATSEPVGEFQGRRGRGGDHADSLTVPVPFGNLSRKKTAGMCTSNLPRSPKH